MGDTLHLASWSSSGDFINTLDLIPDGKDE